MASFLALAFRTTSGGIRLHAGQVSESGTVPEPPPDEFRWSQGCAAFVQLALRSRLAHLQQAPSPAALEGVKDSAAYALYRSFDDVARLAWPATIFGSNQSFQDSLERSSHQGPDGKLYSVRFSSEQVESDRIRLYLDGASISDSVDAVTQLLKTLFGQSSSDYRQLNLGILRSGELAYTRDIETGLRSRLTELGYDLSPTPLSYAGPQVSMRTEDGRRGWEIAVQQRMERGGENGFDFLIGIGTQAMLALKHHFGTKFGIPPDSPKTVFLGVTYPTTAHLIDSLFSRYEAREICGVAYGADGLRAIASLIHNWLVPGSRLNFLYFPEYEQDVDAADQLKRTRLFAEGVLSITETSPETFEKAIQDCEQVYFSWYTCEAIFESHDPKLHILAAKLRERRVVATTRHNCEHRCAFAAAAADDLEIGRQGAEIIHARCTEQIQHLGRQEIVIPRVQYWLKSARHGGTGYHSSGPGDDGCCSHIRVARHVPGLRCSQATTAKRNCGLVRGRRTAARVPFIPAARYPNTVRMAACC